MKHASHRTAENYELMRAAHAAVAAAVRSGVLERAASCEDCGAECAPLQAHHEDYAAPLDVIWLCASCHQGRHSFRLLGLRAERLAASSEDAFEMPPGIVNVPAVLALTPEALDACSEPIRLKPLDDRATELRLDENAEKLRLRIEKNVAKLAAVEKLHRALRAAFKANPGITVRDACRKSQRGAA